MLLWPHACVQAPAVAVATCMHAGPCYGCGHTHVHSTAQPIWTLHLDGPDVRLSVCGGSFVAFLIMKGFFWARLQLVVTAASFWSAL
jgi:hypothetical protein